MISEFENEQLNNSSCEQTVSMLFGSRVELRSTGGCNIELLSETKRGGCFVYAAEISFCEISIALTEQNEEPKHYLITVDDGRAMVKQASACRTLEKGDVFLLNNWFPAEVKIARCALKIVVIPSVLVYSKIFSNARGGAIDLYIPSDHFSSSLIYQATANLIDYEAGIRDDHYLVDMLVGILRVGFGSSASLRQELPQAQGRMGQIIFEIIEKVNQDDISVEMVAKSLKCSARTIQKTCSVNGVSFGRLVIKIRLYIAFHEITRSKGRVSDVAYNCGFKSFSHFCRMFKLQFGVPASYYRKPRAD